MSPVSTRPFEEIPVQERDGWAAADIAQTVLQLSKLTIDFASVYRAPRYCPERRESNVEHSFMLGMVCIEVGCRHLPGLNAYLMGGMAFVHDLPEKITGDQPTFMSTDDELKAKYRREGDATSELQEKLPPHIADLLNMYEEQVLPEARVVRHIDKLLPHAVNVMGKAGMQVMREDYGIHTAPQMLAQNAVVEARYQRMFPEESHDILHAAHSILANTFAVEYPEA